MADQYEKVRDQIDAIEAEMRRIGMWEDEPPPQEALRYTLPYAKDTMAFPQWLQFVFLPQVREIVENYAQLPKRSEIAPAARQQFADWDKSSRLLTLLEAFDDMLERF